MSENKMFVIVIVIVISGCNRLQPIDTHPVYSCIAHPGPKLGGLEI